MALVFGQTGNPLNFTNLSERLIELRFFLDRLNDCVGMFRMRLVPSDGKMLP